MGRLAIGTNIYFGIWQTSAKNLFFRNELFSFWTNDQTVRRTEIGVQRMEKPVRSGPVRR